MSGYPIVIEEDPALDVWSVTKFPRTGERLCRIRYQPAQGKYLDHLVAHECGHIYRFFSARPEDRLLPAMDSNDLKFARDQVAKDSWKQRNMIPKHVIDNLLSFLCSGLVRQVTNTPADCRIEKWVYENFPSLRDVQTAALLAQYSVFRECLQPRIKNCVPASIYEKSNTVNYPLAKTIGQLRNESDLLAPYQDGGFAVMGERLDSYLREHDCGYPGDMRLADAWAKEIAVRDWYRWAKLH